MIGLLADGLTALRFALAIYLAWAGFAIADAQRALKVIVHGLLLGWTADIWDGLFARHASSPTRLGCWDFPLDMFMVFGSLVGITAAGFVPTHWTLTYLAIAAVLIIRFPSKAMTMAVACPAVFAPFLLTVYHAPETFRLSLLWVVAVLIMDWRRFEGIVLEFVDTFPSGKLRPIGEAWRRWKGIALEASSDATERPQ